ncbi:MAG: hypothetical protein ACREV7_13355 [Steroidobacteraceae bacterium]
MNSLGSVDELRLGPDGHTLYLTSNHVIPRVYPKTTDSSKADLRQMQGWNNGNDNIRMINLAPWLQRHAHPDTG